MCLCVIYIYILNLSRKQLCMRPGHLSLNQFYSVLFTNNIKYILGLTHLNRKLYPQNTHKILPKKNGHPIENYVFSPLSKL